MSSPAVKAPLVPAPVAGVSWRSLLALPVLSLVGSAATVNALARAWPELDTRNPALAKALLLACQSLLLMALLTWPLLRGKIRLFELLGRPSARESACALVAGVGVVGLNLGLSYLSFLALAWVAPDFTLQFLLSRGFSAPVDPAFRGLMHTLIIATAVLAAPFAEELLFRGLLLPAWAQRWGTSRAVLLSSLVFGVLHASPLGTMALALAASIAFLSTRKLSCAILLHAANNTIASLLPVLGSSAGATPTLDELRSYAGASALAFAGGAVLLAAAWHGLRWRLPVHWARA